MTTWCERDCPNKGGKVYIHREYASPITQEMVNEMLQLDGKVNTLSQCATVVNISQGDGGYNCIIETCRPTKITDNELNSALSYSALKSAILTRQQTRELIANNPAIWFKPEE